MIAGKRMPEQDEPGDLEALLPWHAAGTLNARDARRVSEALDRDPELARQYAAVLEEYAATIEFNESLGAPSSRAMQKLFAAIDAEPAQPQRSGTGLVGRIAAALSEMSPKALAWTIAVAAFALILQAGLIGAMLAFTPAGVFQTAALQDRHDQPGRAVAPGNAPVAEPQAVRTAPAVPVAPPAAPAAKESSAPTALAMADRPSGPVVRSLAPDGGPRFFVRFVPDARATEIVALLDQYKATVVSSAGGVFRLQVGDHALTKADQDRLIRRLENESIVAVVQPAP
ncbi:hypothetical protein [Rhodopseudomonas sp. B29]|uniref:hypothetical protein n=1 Tax=Rhodopseudomonas sp. B29 TaxID=95607 RepID=UPI00034D447A|nr:hypothetical protein [Rhodopseudomonas sp. B29]